MNDLKLFTIVYCVFSILIIGSITYSIFIKPSSVVVQNTKQVTCVVEQRRDNIIYEWHGVVK